MIKNIYLYEVHIKYNTTNTNMSNSIAMLKFLEHDTFGYDHPDYHRNRNFHDNLTRQLNNGDVLTSEQIFGLERIYNYVESKHVQRHQEPEWTYNTPEKRSYDTSVIKSSRRYCVKKQVIKPIQKHKITSYFMKISQDKKCADLLSNYEKSLKPVSINDFFAKK